MSESAIGTLDWVRATSRRIAERFGEPSPAPIVAVERALDALPRDAFLASLASMPLRNLPAMLASESIPLLRAARAASPLPRGSVSRIRAHGAASNPPGSASHLAVGFGQDSDGTFRIEARLQRPNVEAEIRARALAERHGAGRVRLATVHGVTAHSGSSRTFAGLGEQLALGASVGARDGAAGSVGAFVQTAEGREAVLSCSHILARSGLSQAGDEVFHPAPGAGRLGRPHAIGHLDRFEDLRLGGVRPWDAAVAVLAEGAGHCGNRVPSSLACDEAGRVLGAVACGPLPPFPTVCKVGQRTGWTTGRVEAENLSLEIEFQDLNRAVEIEDLIEIAWERREDPFSQPGDSGGLVFLRDGLAPVGLVVGGGEIELEDGTVAGRSYACRLDPLLAAWGLALL